MLLHVISYNIWITAPCSQNVTKSGSRSGSS